MFHDRNGEAYIVVGTAKNLKLMPRSCSCGYVYVYAVAEDGSCLKFLHKTEVNGIPGALCPFQGRLLIGVNNILRIYDIGKKRLLRKAENRVRA